MDQDGREVPGTRSHDAVKPACKYVPVVETSRWTLPFHQTFSVSIPGLSSVAPPTVRPLPRPDVTPPPNADATLLYAQGQKIGALPLNGTRLDANRATTLLTLHVRGESENRNVPSA